MQGGCAWGVRGVKSGRQVAKGKGRRRGHRSVHLVLYKWLVTGEKQTMPRQMRIDFPGAIHHVMSRGDRRENITLYAPNACWRKVVNNYSCSLNCAYVHRQGQALRERARVA